MLNAEFLAAVQIIVYAGAILILYLFVLMLMNLKTEEQHLHKKPSYILFVGMGLFAELLILLIALALWREDRNGHAGSGFGNRPEPCDWHHYV